MSQTKPENDPLADVRQGMSVHHGKTPAAWAGALISLVGFFVGGIGLVLGPVWVVFWIGVAMVVVALILTRVLQVMGYGAKGGRAAAQSQH